MLLGTGLLGLGLAIQHDIIVPPALDLRHAFIHIVAYRTHYPECLPSTLCPPQSVAPPEEYYAVWLIDERATAEQPYGRTSTRLLVVPLRH
jgi:hypothetical protein